MTDQSSIFGNQNPATQPNPDPQQGSTVQPDPALITLLSEIKNERGEQKYKDINSALIALRHSQDHIANLTNSKSQLEADLARSKTEADRIAELERTLQSLTQEVNKPAPQTGSSLTPEQIADLVSQNINQREQQQTVKQNTEAVANALKDAFGAEAEKKYNDKAAELGISVAELNVLAAKSPKAVLTYFNVTPKASVFTPPNSTINTDALRPPQDTNIRRNQTSALMGATRKDMQQEMKNGQDMIAELEAKGMSINDLTDPKVYSKFFG